MKRAVALIGVLALLGTLFVLASSSPASAEPNSVEVQNAHGWPTDSANPITVTAAGCGWTREAVPVEIAANATGQIELDTSCDGWVITAVDSTGACTIEYDAGVLPDQVSAEGTWLPGDSVEVDGNYDGAVAFRTSNTCAREFPYEISKDMTKYYEDNDRSDDPAGALTTFTFEFANDDDRCTEGATYTVTGEDLPPPEPHGSDDVDFPVISGYIENNMLVACNYTTTEIGPPPGWTLDMIFVSDGESCTEVTLSEAKAETDGVCAAEESGGDDKYEVNFLNSLDPIPLTVTKTFVGRDYYTTVDRGDFHMFMPGLCGNIPVDPFGGLLGSVGVFRTINASQYPQIVFALPSVPAALYTEPKLEEFEGRNDPPAAPCTYRVQENNAPEGCVALDPTGSDADGPYWEQTWVSGETLAFDFNIVNDCSDPEPTPEPTVAPTTTPKKPGTPGAKKPSSGGSAAPKFTG
ncbi:MAG: hypothetical protein ACR2NL_13095 [Acidimicrobiia bacterium]